MDIDTNQHSQTIAEFCAHERISKATFYKLRAAGLGPDELRAPKTTIVRITAEARAAWHQRMADLRNSEAVLLEEAHRREQAVAAGKIAALSAQHVSRRGRVKARARRRKVA